MRKQNSWALQDAKARFSELLRSAKKGKPQEVTVRGKNAVLVVDPERYEVRRKAKPARDMSRFVETAARYRLDNDVDFDRPLDLDFPLRTFEETGEDS